ncbi:MAG: thiol-disulfide oxidoreductase DCC family protein [Marinirhabdus sp.]
MKKDKEHKVILFDGVCNLCNASVNFVIRHDPNDVFRFAALQEGVGQQYIKKHAIDTSKTDSIILIDGERAYVKATAALRIARHLNGAWPLLYSFMILPKPIRNRVYDLVARNRYKWYGKRESCTIPTPELQRKFL